MSLMENGVNNLGSLCSLELMSSLLLFISASWLIEPDDSVTRESTEANEAFEDMSIACSQYCD